METKHTPGPWVIDWNVSRLDIFGSNETALVASLRRSTLSQTIDEAARANARLIAAAPELLQALEYARGYLRGKNFDPGMRDAIATVIEAAIAKAEGK